MRGAKLAMIAALMGLGMSGDAIEGSPVLPDRRNRGRFDPVRGDYEPQLSEADKAAIGKAEAKRARKAEKLRKQLGGDA